MEKEQKTRDNFSELRNKAEAFLNKTPSAVKKVPPEDVKKLVEELQIYQVELEMQNEELRQAQLELKEARDRFSDLYDFAPVGYFTINDKGMILEANLTGVTMLGVERRFVTINPFSHFISVDTQDIFYQHRKELFETKTPQTFDLKLVKEDGTEFWARLECIIVQDAEGNFNRIRAAVSNIEERKASEERLRDSEERYRTLVESSKDAIFLNDEAGRFISVNQAACQSLGYSKEELLELSMKEIDVDPRGYEAFIKLRDGVMGQIVFEVNQQRKDGTLIPVEITGTAFSSGGKRLFLAIARDLTERKRLEATLFQAEKMKAISTLAGGIAHLFNNSLSSITGYTDLLEMQFPDDERIKTYLNPMKQSAHKMAGWTSQLVAYSKGGKYQPEIVSLSDLIEETLELIKPALSPEIRVETDLSRGILNIEADRSQTQMVLSALMSNSNEAIEGEGRIRVVVRDEEISEGHPELNPGSYVCLSVEDDGKGMDEETRAKMFDPFFTTNFMGRGLGMAAVLGVVKNHGGEIYVDTEPGKGTVVRIYLPGIEVVEEEREAVYEPLVEQ